ncbi:Uncharacterised protein [Vibrio cholerae]|nr:Uncharacterised protein [Vibrio cholerae]CSI31279.1 Uncharacterised protein [Vibrio cholerae]
MYSVSNGGSLRIKIASNSESAMVCSDLNWYQPLGSSFSSTTLVSASATPCSKCRSFISI